MSNYAGIIKNDTAAAPGLCLSIYLSGCPLHCKGCHNPDLQSYDYGNPLTEEKMKEILNHLEDNGIHRDLCILGGEPLSDQNIATTFALVANCRVFHPDSKIYIWTGYEFEQFQKSSDEMALRIFDLIDYLIDGPYVEELRDITLKMRGSKNQRIIDMKATMKNISESLVVIE